MIESLSLQYVKNYIKNNIGHEKSHERSAIFNAISEGMAETFTEDNSITRIDYAVELLLKNDKEFMRLCTTHEDFKQSVADCLKNTISEMFIPHEKKKEPTKQIVHGVKVLLKTPLEEQELLSPSHSNGLSKFDIVKCEEYSYYVYFVGYSTVVWNNTLSPFDQNINNRLKKKQIKILKKKFPTLKINTWLVDGWLIE